MTKPTMLHVYPEQTQVIMGIASEIRMFAVQLKNVIVLNTNWVHSDVSDQTVQMVRLALFFSGVHAIFVL